jgi:hypothetical protein
MVPAGRVGIGGRPVIPGVMVDVSIPRIETVIAGPCAAIAPVPVVGRHPRMPGAMSDVSAKIRRLCGNGGAADNSKCCGQCQSLHGDRNAHNVTQSTSGLQCFHRPEPGGKSQRPNWLNIGSRMSLTDCAIQPDGCVSGTISTIILVIAFTIRTSPFIFTYL